MTTDSFIPLMVFMALAIAVVAQFYLPALIFGPKDKSEAKLAPFECGNEAEGEPTIPFNPRFYQVAILFLVFDIEVAFLYPWLVLFGDLGMYGIITMFIFLIVLVLGLVYVIRKGVLKWV